VFYRILQYVVLLSCVAVGVLRMLDKPKPALVILIVATPFWITWCVMDICKRLRARKARTPNLER
jgi:hypothetical protein